MGLAFASPFVTGAGSDRSTWGRDPALADAVGQFLDQHQGDHRRRLLLARLKRETRDAIRAQMPALRRALALYGLRLRGLGHVVWVRRKRQVASPQPAASSVPPVSPRTPSPPRTPIQNPTSQPHPYPRTYDGLLTETVSRNRLAWPERPGSIKVGSRNRRESSSPACRSCTMLHPKARGPPQSLAMVNKGNNPPRVLPGAICSVIITVIAGDSPL